MMDQEMQERLQADAGLQSRLTTFARNRVRYSRDWMSPRYDRWRESERTCRLFREADASDEETRAESLTEGVQKIVVPATYAQIWSMLAFLMNAITDRKPMIPVEGVGPRDVKPAMLHELLLEYQWDSQPEGKGILALLQFFHDGLRYGVGVGHNSWALKIWSDFVRNYMPVMLGGQIVGYDDHIEEQDVVAYEGNEFRNIQPYDWLPDPRTGSLAKFQQGDFCGHAFILSRMEGEQLEDEGLYSGIDQVPEYAAKNAESDSGSGGRGIFPGISDLAETIGMDREPTAPFNDADGDAFLRCVSLYARVSPKSLRLPDYGQDPGRARMWLFTLANNNRVIRAERANLPGRRYPYVIFESNYDVHAPANPGVVEVIQGLQYISSWLLNSRLANVRRNLNQETLLDPSLVEREDWSRSNPSGIWRLTKNAMQSGISLDQIVKPLPIQDVTQGHLQDFNNITSMMELATGASRQIQGLANPGRRAATEVQGQMSMAAGRMRLMLLIAGAQGITDLAEQQIANNRAFLEQRLTLRIRDQNYQTMLGQDFLDVTPDLLQGQFRVPLLEGGIPTDKLMHANVLREMLQMGLQNPQVAMQLSQQINWSEIFAELMRVLNKRNLRDFFNLQPPQPQMPPGMEVQGQEQVQQGVQAGNLVPADGAPYFGADSGAPGMGRATPLLQ